MSLKSNSTPPAPAGPSVRPSIPTNPSVNVTTTAIPQTNRSNTFLPSMRAEWIKIWSLRSNWIMVGLATVFAGLISWAFATYADEPITSFELVTGGIFLTLVFAIIAGVLTHTSEEQNGTLASTLMGQPSRLTMVAAKAFTAAGLGLLIGAMSIVGSAIGGVISGEAVGDIINDGVFNAGWGLVLTTLGAVFGLGLGMIVRHSAAAISGILAWWLIAELLIIALVPARFGRFLPFNMAYGIIGQSESGDLDFDQLFTQTESAFLFGGYALLLVAIGTLILTRRDIS